jgi:hypothetical protein
LFAPGNALQHDVGDGEDKMLRYRSEPLLDELLADPILHLMMQADGVDGTELCAVIAEAGAKLACPSRTRDPAAALRA